MFISSLKYKCKVIPVDTVSPRNFYCHETQKHHMSHSMNEIVTNLATTQEDYPSPVNTSPTTQHTEDLSQSPSTQILFSESNSSSNPKKCEACNATSTPQWRRGPSGSRTLCNACGVKYSQGRPLIMKTMSSDSQSIIEKIYYKNHSEPEIIIRPISNDMDTCLESSVPTCPQQKKKKKKHTLPQPTLDELMAIDLEQYEDLDSDMEQVLVENFLFAVHDGWSKNEIQKNRSLYSCIG